MYIIVIGGGKVGFHLAWTLVEEGYEVLVIERDGSVVERIEDRLGSIVMQGDGAESSILDAAGASRADVIIASTGDDEDNLIVCQVAKRRFNVERVIARVNNPKNELLFKRLGIDVTVSQTNVLLHLIEQRIDVDGLTHLMTLQHDAIEIVEARVADDSAVVGRTLAEIKLPPECVFSAITRGEHVVVPTGGTRIEAGDEVIAVTRTENEAALRRLLVGT
ncbi:MAG: NAD-binding protein [Thermomicrobiales bacterium]